MFLTSLFFLNIHFYDTGDEITCITKKLPRLSYENQGRRAYPCYHFHLSAASRQESHQVPLSDTLPL